MLIAVKQCYCVPETQLVHVMVVLDAEQSGKQQIQRWLFESM